MYDSIRELIAGHAGSISAQDITMETNFYIDLGWTSLDMVDCLVDLEDVCGKSIPDERMGSIQTVADLIAELEA